MSEAIEALRRLLALGDGKEQAIYDDLFAQLNVATGVAKPANRLSSDLTTKTHELVSVVKSLVSLLVTQNEELEALKDRIKKIEEKEPASSSSGSPSLFSNMVKKNIKLTPAETNVLNAVTHESIEQQKRSRNVMVYGVPAPTGTEEQVAESDKKTVSEILVKIGCIGEDGIGFKKVQRLRGNTSGRPAPIMVELDVDKCDRLAVLKEAAKLSKIPSLKHIFVGPDLTPAQRDRRKQLLAECKRLNEPNIDAVTKKFKTTYRFGIRNDSVVKISITPSN